MGFITRLQAVQTNGGRTVSFLLTGSGTEREPPVVVQVLEWSQSRSGGWRVVLKLVGSKEHWERYWSRLGIAGCSPGEAAEKIEKNLLALWPRQSDESSCATSAPKETEMTNTESRSTAKDGAATAKAATKTRSGARKATGGKAATKGKRTASPRKTGGGAARGQGRGKAASTPMPVKKPRAESKGAQILELIEGAKGATLSELMQATKWQAHSIRGYLSTAAKKQQMKIASFRNDSGERVYKLER
jgi:hypothetical protein